MTLKSEVAELRYEVAELSSGEKRTRLLQCITHEIYLYWPGHFAL